MLEAQGIGRLTKDPELRYTAQGTAVCGMRVACDQGKDHTEFINLVVWEKQGEAAANHLKKGRLVFFRGRLNQREYDKKDGGKGLAVECVVDVLRFLDRAPGEKEEQPPLPPDPNGGK
jgi:single-strand DNA-binding protein